MWEYMKRHERFVRDALDGKGVADWAGRHQFKGLRDSA